MPTTPPEPTLELLEPVDDIPLAPPVLIRQDADDGNQD